MKIIETLWLGFRSTLFLIGFAFFTIIAGLLTPFLFLLPPALRLKILMTWTHANSWWLKVTCGIRYTIKNPENLDRSSAHIVLANHQSTWETIVIPTFIPPFAWVLKKELFKIPFFGWAIQQVSPIAIDRKAGRSAIDQIKFLGKEKLDNGTWICMFPEGTRVEPGKTARYKLGGAILASHSGYPIIPMAHNAGECWPRHSYIKRPGTITVSIGPKIMTKDRDAQMIMNDVKEWIEAEKKTLPPV